MPEKNGDASLELAFKAARQDKEAFEKLVQLHAPGLYRFLVARGAQPHTAEDVAQETFIKAYRHIEKFNGKASFNTWLFSIAIRTLSDHRRRESKRKVSRSIHENEAVYDGREEMEKTVDESPSLWELAKEALTDNEYSLLWMHYAEEIPQPQMAEILDISGLNLRVKLHRAKARLRDYLLRHDYDRGL